MTEPPNLILGQHRIAPNRNLVGGSNSGQTPGGNPQNMAGKEWYSIYHRKVCVIIEVILGGQLTDIPVIKQGLYGFIPIVQTIIQRIGGGTHKGSWDTENYVALKSQNVTGHVRGSEYLYPVPVVTWPGLLGLTIKLKVETIKMICKYEG